MKAITFVLALFAATCALAADETEPRSLHELCTQNQVCSDGLYCRRYNGAVFGTCEDPDHT
ncbi:hypothetical protein BCR43DRAFT_526596 [Syncephalastrum racemosum]|uniref:Dickkopf N-terminal cysteine-rich domain-containing protein n=1 Tax=Syncephalastrum racemosum TaxID=13706 RepID=A0A1X2H6Z2_SYNRA|nr:hypothetical protein BCR43DRAFT_526596 [Syncephalastrum racemosum]